MFQILASVTTTAMVDLISAATTRSGLTLTPRLDKNQYPTKARVSDSEMAQLEMKPHKFHGEWNYAILPS